MDCSVKSPKFHVGGQVSSVWGPPESLETPLLRTCITIELSAPKISFKSSSLSSCSSSWQFELCWAEEVESLGGCRYHLWHRRVWKPILVQSFTVCCGSREIGSAGEYMTRNRKLFDAQTERRAVAVCLASWQFGFDWTGSCPQSDTKLAAWTRSWVLGWASLCLAAALWTAGPRRRHLSASTHKPPVFGVVSCTRFRLHFSLVTGQLAPRFKNVADVKHVVFERTLKYLRCGCAVLSVRSTISLVSSAKNTMLT